MNTRHLVAVYVVRPTREGSHDALQLLRSPGRYMAGTWQQVAGGIEASETAFAAAKRELEEETSLADGMWYQLDLVNTFFIAKDDSIVHSVQFLFVAPTDCSVRLNAEHAEFRWVSFSRYRDSVMWPGERSAIEEIARILRGETVADHLRLN